MDAKDAIRESIEKERGAPVELSHRIHASSELGFEDEKAAAWLSEALVDGALAMAWTGVDLAIDEAMRRRFLPR